MGIAEDNNRQTFTLHYPYATILELNIWINGVSWEGSAKAIYFLLIKSYNLNYSFFMDEWYTRDKKLAYKYY